MLKLTQAWRTTGGDCFEQKQQAYNAEILHLYRSLPKWDGKRQIVKNQIKKLSDSVSQWLKEADTLIGDIGDEKDRDVEEKQFVRFTEKVREWTKDSEGLLDEIGEETDVETGRFMSGQGG